MAKSLLATPPSDDDPYPNDRLPSEQVIGGFSLRGYRGPTVLVSSRRYFSGTTKLEGLTRNHAADMARRGWPVSRDYVEKDIRELEELAEQCDAVRVVPAY
jgi:hypothetical protein